jgi:hypothetical protein
MLPSPKQEQMAAAIGNVVTDILYHPKTIPMISLVAVNVINDWAEGSRLRRILASPVKMILNKQISKQRSGHSFRPETSISGSLGKFITLFAASVNENRRVQNPDVRDLKRGDATKNFLASTDFGEVLEMVEGCEEGALKTMQAFNEELWKYPSKFATIAAMVVPLSRIVTRCSREFLSPIDKQIGPDLLADIVLALVKGMDGAEVGHLVNTIKELIRRAHTGSLLLGKGDKSLLEIYLQDIMKAYYSVADPELARKLPIYFGEMKEAIANANAKALEENPKALLAKVSSAGAVKTSAIKAKSCKLKVLEGIEEADLKASVSVSMTELDTYEIADYINTGLKFLNKIYEADPNLISSTFRGIADSINSEEVAKTVQWLIPDLIDAIRPLSPAFVPALAQGLNELAASADIGSGNGYAKGSALLGQTVGEAGGVQ